MHTALAVIRARLQALAPVATTADPADAEFQRLEFLGDAHLQLAVTEALMDTVLLGFASPHTLTTERAKMISNAHLATVFEALQLDTVTRTPRDASIKAKADTMEAAIGELSLGQHARRDEALELRKQLISLIATLSFK